MKQRLLQPLRNSQSGFLLILMLVQSFVVLTILTGVMGLGLYNLGAAKRSTYTTNAIYAAEAGADRFMYEINESSSYAGTNTICPISSSGSNPVTLYSNAQGRATYETCVTNGTIANEKIVYAVGKVYVPAASLIPKSTKTVRLIIEGTPSAGYIIQTGPGGLVMSNSSTITAGPIYVGGFLTMSNTARIGSAASPLGVSIANQRCPVPVNASWPQVCPMGTQNDPITITNSARIYGDVKANGQVTTTGLSDPGLTASNGVAAVTLPDYDRDGQKTAVANNLTGTNASCSGSQTRNWPANVKITGNVTVSNNCIVTMAGNVWITGNITVSNNGQLKLAAGLTTAPTVMIDGSSGITMSNQSVVATNSNGIGANFITFYSTAGCSPDCSSVTGSSLNSSMNVQTVSIDNQGLAANSTFYARWTALTLHNGGTIGAIMAQKITLSNSGNITFGSNTSGGGSSSWDVRYYETL